MAFPQGTRPVFRGKPYESPLRQGVQTRSFWYRIESCWEVRPPLVRN